MCYNIKRIKAGCEYVVRARFLQLCLKAQHNSMHREPRKEKVTAVLWVGTCCSTFYLLVSYTFIKWAYITFFKFLYFPLVEHLLS